MTLPPPDIDAPPEGLAAVLAQGPAEEAAARLTALVRAEDRLVADNVVKPYLDKVPKVIALLAPERVAALVALLAVEDARRALFGNYTRIPDELLRRLLVDVPPATAMASTSCAAAAGGTSTSRRRRSSSGMRV